MHARYAILAAALLPAPLRAQAEDAKLWTTALASVPVAEEVRLDVEFQGRFSDDAGGIYETVQAFFLSRPLGKVTVAIGYQRNDSARTSPATVEDRLRQQVAAELARIAGGTLSGRLRFEQRFRSDGRDTHFRLRPQIAYSRPFRAGGDTRWTISHESFLGTEADWTSQRGLFRMRNQAVVRTPIVEGVTIEGGYMNQYGFGRDGARDTMDHIALLSLTYTR